jgi:hypothetical protein
MKDAAVTLNALLYPAEDSLLREDHHELLAAMLDDAAARRALEEQVRTRIERRRIAANVWELTAAGVDLSSSNEEPLVQASARLAKLLEARSIPSLPMSRLLLLTFVIGCLIGALAVLLLRYLSPSLLK